MSRAYIRYLFNFYEEKQERKERRKNIRSYSDPAELPENEYLENFKVSEEMVAYLCEELEADLAPRTGQGLPVMTKVLTSLKVLLDGHYQRGTGKDENLCIAQTTVSKYVTQFADAVNLRLKPKWIQFPGTETARQAVAQNFESKFGLPDILGAIDCTQIKIFPPLRPNQAQYLNRHNEMTINVQLIADADCRILHVNANYPGRVHDQFIFNYSNVKQEMKRLYLNRIGQYYLLGDSGYALEPWIMIPIRNAPPGSPEQRFSEWQCQSRNVVERLNGNLKGTFRCLGLDRRLHYEAKKASDLIYACCTLYNIMKHFRTPLEYEEQQENEVNENQVVEPQVNRQFLRAGIQRRSEIIHRYFS